MHSAFLQLTAQWTTAADGKGEVRMEGRMETNWNGTLTVKAGGGFGGGGRGSTSRGEFLEKTSFTEMLSAR